MLCQLQVYSKVNQLYIYSLIFRFLSHIGHYRLLSRVPCATQQVLISYLFYIQQFVYVHATLSLHPSLPFPLPVSSSPFSMSASLVLSCPQVLQNHYFLDSIYMCQHMVFVFLFLTYFTLYDRLYVHTISFLFMAE